MRRKAALNGGFVARMFGNALDSPGHSKHGSRASRGMFGCGLGAPLPERASGPKVVRRVGVPHASDPRGIAALELDLMHPWGMSDTGNVSGSGYVGMQSPDGQWTWNGAQWVPSASRPDRRMPGQALPTPLLVILLSVVGVVVGLAIISVLASK